MAKVKPALSDGFREKASSMEKPPLFAFCLKPRGLEVPHKGSKQRSHRKFPVSGHSHTVQGDQDGFHAFGNFICCFYILVTSFCFHFEFLVNLFLCIREKI